ncbi:HD domain-containing phosphohydrolase [Lysinibacillus sp. BPa_S21]|uniref:HD domain-containing phosphohydrolase n=1 Tax=Lysinibacillus sp. BPa_S21 TaxID=2932478 RepID=UPI0020115EC1|nr:HD domain-containing phosphohydrolase [Lysinibacillus sp. BPa_S21]MCL1696737.1 HD domain-containing protein [Lysinibacillus sp. BPa_S21]
MQIPEELTYYLKLGDAVAIVDENRLIIDVNTKYEEITGSKRESLIGLYAEYLNSNIVPINRNRSLSNGEPWSGIIPNLYKSTERKYYSVTITPIKINEEVYYIVVMRSEEQPALDQDNLKELYKVIALSSEIRDRGIAEHLKEVQSLTERFLLVLKEEKKYNLSVGYISKIIDCSILHDIGKSGIPESILYKPGPLTFYERKIMEMHPLIGVDVLLDISNGMNIRLVDDLDIASNIIKFHHEKWDGTGYPLGLKGAQIPLEARVIAIVDVYDALTSKRPYKEAWPQEKATAYLKSQKGIQFDPYLIDIFIDKVVKINQ